MTPEAVPFFRSALSAWFSRHRRSLPWRQTDDPYRIWVSEVMLQQTQVKTVISYYERFIERYPDVTALSRAPLEQVLKTWEGLGYYARARNLHRAAKEVAANHQKTVPDRWEPFSRLPGVGDYIASAVLSIAFGQGYPVVDGNVKRVLSRLFLEPAPVNRPSAHRVFKALAGRLLDPGTPGLFNQAMMELGAMVCRPGRPLCGACPVTGFCGAGAGGVQALYPKRDKRPKVETRRVAVGVIRNNGKLLITRRKPEGLLGGLWEFPGGKIGENESPEAALHREILEEVGLSVRIDSHLARVRHAYTHFKVEIEVFDCRYVGGEVRLSGAVDHRWVRPQELSEFPFPGANRKFMPLLTKTNPPQPGSSAKTVRSS